MSMETTNLTIEKIRQMFAEGKRFDGRGLLDYRPIEVTYGVSNKAEGSARVKIGKTEVIVGVKMQVAAPYPDSPDKGSLAVSADLLPLASPRFEMGPPRFEAVELPRIVDRGVRESGIIEFEKLVIKSGEKVWNVLIDIYPLNDDGNLTDAAGIAAMAALRDVKLPGLDKEGKIDYDIKTKEPLPLRKETNPIPVSFFKLGDSIVLDPTREEEEACDVRIVWTASMWGDEVMINSCQKSGKVSVPLSEKDISTMMEILPKKFDELSKKLKKFL